MQVTIDAQAIERSIGTRDHLLIDARAADRYRGENETIDPVGGHIPGSLNHFFKDNLTAEGRFKTAHELREAFNSLIGATPPDRIVLQCGSGVTACHNAIAMEICGTSRHGALSGLVERVERGSGPAGRDSPNP
ncbi:MAG: Thiosulfate sulfurtransferase, rhodanese (EC [uncultured Caballeronia sp.]|nr:MAG: Thiosulfate sulfurtransferase, rhodanese (EC [uncultured Caballeronia sp.]